MQSFGPLKEEAQATLIDRTMEHLFASMHSARLLKDMFVLARPAEKQAEEKQVSKRVNTGSGSAPGMSSDVL